MRYTIIYGKGRNQGYWRVSQRPWGRFVRVGLSWNGSSELYRIIKLLMDETFKAKADIHILIPCLPDTLLCLFAAKFFYEQWTTNYELMSNFFEYFQTFHTIFRTFSNVSLYFSNVFNRFWTFSNVSILPILPNRYSLTPQSPFLTPKPTSPPENNPQKTQFLKILDF